MGCRTPLKSISYIGALYAFEVQVWMKLRSNLVSEVGFVYEISFPIGCGILRCYIFPLGRPITGRCDCFGVIWLLLSRCHVLRCVVSMRQEMSKA
jgi:hypothetical protein